MRGFGGADAGLGALDDVEEIAVVVFGVIKPPPTPLRGQHDPARIGGVEKGNFQQSNSAKSPPDKRHNSSMSRLNAMPGHQANRHHSEPTLIVFPPACVLLRNVPCLEPIKKLVQNPTLDAPSHPPAQIQSPVHQMITPIYQAVPIFLFEELEMRNGILDGHPPTV